MPDRSPDSLSPAEELFADWLVRREGDGGADDLESLCRDHPRESAELRKLWIYWEGIRAVLEKAGVDADPRSLGEKIRDKFGSGVDPNVSLDAGGEVVPPSDALLKRLAEHTLKASRYKLRGEIARGGMGAILKVWDEDLRRNLAMKVILGKGETPSGETPPVNRRLLARFLEEAQVTGQLDHPGIVPVHELGLDSEGRVYFTMKLVKGRDLKQIFDLVFEEREGWNETRALSVILKVCEAMAYAHAKGVIHRDLKPANIMVGNFGEVYVMDWGLARVEGREDRHDVRLQAQGTPLTSLRTERREEREEAPDSPLFTMDGDVVGTPAYMSPEQARGEVVKLGPRSDVYAVGAMLYHLLARQMPYVPLGARVSNRAVLGMVLHGAPPALHGIRRNAPAELVAICEKAMARKSDWRYANTLELAEDLRAYLENRVVKAYGTGAVVELRKWILRNRFSASVLLASAVLLVAGVIASWMLKTRADRYASLASERLLRNQFVGIYSALLWASEDSGGLLSLEELIDARNPQGLPYLPAALSVTDPWGMRFQVISDHSQSEEPTPFSRKRDETWSIVSSGPDRVLETSDDIEYRDELVESNRRKREALREMNEIFSAIGLYTTALQGARHEDLRFPVVNLPSVEELLHRNVLMREDSIADPWGNKYLLEETEVGSDNPKDYYRVRCLGPDGQTGTEDDLTYSNFDWRTHMEESSRRLRARK